jgi:hypothetical protein
MKLPSELERQLSEVCRLLGMSERTLVADAVREKLDALLDAYNLRSSLRKAAGHAPWDTLKKNYR